MLWLEGRLHEGTAAPFDLADRGLLLADGLFETLLAVAGVPYCLDEHLARLEAGAAVLRLPVPLAEARRAITALAEAATGPVVIRLTVTRGTGPRGLRPPADPAPRLFATAAPWSPETAFGPATLATSGIRRNAGSPLSRLKSLCYLDNVLALDEAAGRGADDALLLSTGGMVACTSMANLFALFGRTLLTPPAADGVLPGITRALVLRLAAGAGLTAEERSLRPEALAQADALFATNSVRLIAPVTALDGSALPRAAAVDALGDALRRHLRETCGRDPFA